MIKQLIVSPVLIFSLITSVHNFQKEFPSPVENKEDIKITKTREALTLLGAPTDKIPKLTKACYSASITTDIDPVLIACIIPKESEFNISAKSSKGYKGLMQTPKAEMKWSRASTDVMKGAEILKEKIDEAKGDVDRGMVFYKGKGGLESQAFAKKQMKYYREVRDRVNEIIKEKEKKANG